MAMSEKLHLDQVFYGAGPAGYGILATSFAEEALAQAAVNACLAIGLVPGSGLVKSILLSRILGDRIVMARICNGAKDTSGRNTLFIHALVASVQEVRSARVSTFSLADAAIFCNRISDSSAKPLLVDAGHSVGAETHETLELPAAIMTPEPDEEIMRRVVHGRENLLSWSTFAFDDMQGYDVICLSPLVSSPVGRNIYDSDLRLICGVTVKRNASASVSPLHVEKPSGPPQRNLMPMEDVRKGRNGLLIPLLLSVVINVFLFAVLALPQTTAVMRGAEMGSKSQSNEIVAAAKRMFTGKNAVTDLGPIQNLLTEDNNHNEDEKEKAQRELLKKLLAYKNFVEEFILNQTKEK